MGKGVSAQEKKDRMVAMFHETADVYNLKDVMKGASSRGIVSGAVESTLKECAGDDLVQEGKVGVSTYYWSFPAAGASKKRAALDAARADLTKQQRLAATLQEQLDAATATAAGGEGDAAARSAAEEATAAARERERLALAEAERLRKSGAQDLRKRRADCLVLKESANRWTDNLFELRKQLVERGFDPKDADKALGTGNLDFID